MVVERQRTVTDIQGCQMGPHPRRCRAPVRCNPHLRVLTRHWDAIWVSPTSASSKRTRSRSPGEAHLPDHPAGRHLQEVQADNFQKSRRWCVCGTLVEGPIKAGDAEGAHADGQIHHIGPNAAAQRVGHPIRRTIDQNRRHIIAAGALQYN